MRARARGVRESASLSPRPSRAARLTGLFLSPGRHIDSDLDKPYPLEIEDVTGTRAQVNLEPGSLVFYESAKAFHQRSQPLVGRYYASIFMHFRPKNLEQDWPYSREQVKTAIPPHW